MVRRFKLFQKADDIPLKYKFMLILVFCVVLPIVIINIIFFNKISSVVISKENNTFDLSIDRVKNDILSIIEGGIAVSNYIFQDNDLYEILNTNYKEESDAYSYYTKFKSNRFSSYTSSYNGISAVTILTSNKTIEHGGGYKIIDESVMDSGWYKLFKTTQQDMILWACLEKDPANPDRVVRTLSIIRKLNGFSYMDKSENYVKVDIDTFNVNQALHKEKALMTLYFTISNTGAVWSNDKIYEKEMKFETFLFEQINLNKGDTLLERELNNATIYKGFKIIGIKNQQIIVSALSKSRNFIIWLTCVSVLLATLIIIIIARSYNYRVNKLSKYMKNIDNEHPKPFVIEEGKDEIGDLIKSYNIMVAKIDMLINDVYKLEIQKKDFEFERVKAELNFLQSQMDPHFLFNTLNAILVACVKYKYDNITEIIKYLALTLRRLLSWKEDLVTVKEEISFIEMYLQIEKFRFGDKFNYEIFIDNTAELYHIPKMSIQPLVENACKHGLQQIKGDRMLEIHIGLTQQVLSITVSDNGKGIEEEKLSGIIDNIKNETTSSNGIGLKNIYRRLKIYYGDKVDFEIVSQLNQGTKVNVIIQKEVLNFSNV